MLVGGYIGFVAVLTTQSFWLGLLVGAIGGVLTSLLLLVLSVWFGLTQIVVGIAITLAGSGITSVLHTQNYESTNPPLGLAEQWAIPGLSDIPVVGPGLFEQPGMFYVTLVLAGVVAWFLARTNGGLQLRAARQKPRSLDAAGGSVIKIRSRSARGWGLLGAWRRLSGTALDRYFYPVHDPGPARNNWEVVAQDARNFRLARATAYLGPR